MSFFSSLGCDKGTPIGSNESFNINELHSENRYFVTLRFIKCQNRNFAYLKRRIGITKEVSSGGLVIISLTLQIHGLTRFKRVAKNFKICWKCIRGIKV